MLGLKVQLNDGTPIVAGKDDICVLSAIVNVVGKIGPNKREQGVNRDLVDAHFSVRGLTGPIDGDREHVTWSFLDSLKAGDRLTVEIVDSDSFDEPTEIEKANDWSC